MFAELHS